MKQEVDLDSNKSEEGRIRISDVEKDNYKGVK